MTRIKQSFQLVFSLGESDSLLFINKMTKILTSIDYLKTIFSITSYFIAYPRRQSYSKKPAKGQFLTLRKQLLKYFLNDRLFAKYLQQLLLTRLMLQESVRNSKIISDDNKQSLKLLILN